MWVCAWDCWASAKDAPRALLLIIPIKPLLPGTVALLQISPVMPLLLCTARAILFKGDGAAFITHNGASTGRVIAAQMNFFVLYVRKMTGF
jgi:hypothetical protein